MRAYPRILVGLAALTLMLVPALEAHAYCRSTTCKGGECPRDDNNCKTTGQKLFWPTSCLGFSVQKDGTELIAMKYIEQTVHAAVGAWTGLACDGGTATLSFSELSQVTCHSPEYNPGGANANVIMFQDTKWTYTDVTNTLAKTTVTFDDQTGEILDADMEVNHAYNDITVSDEVVKYDLQSIMTHEFGHFIGLDHTPDEDATMFASYDPGTIDLRTLEADDIAAACDAYPPSRTAKCNPTPRGGWADVCGSSTSGASKGCSIADAVTKRDGATDPMESQGLVSLTLLATSIFLGRRRIKRARGDLGRSIGSSSTNRGFVGGKLGRSGKDE